MCWLAHPSRLPAPFPPTSPSLRASLSATERDWMGRGGWEAMRRVKTMGRPLRAAARPLRNGEGLDGEGRLGGDGS